MVNYYFFLCALLLIPFSIDAFAEIWNVQIPSGSSDPNSTAHFLPSEISIRPNDNVEWANADTASHTITSGTLESGLTGLFDSGYLNPGEKFTLFFNEQELGEIKYFCTLHPWMTGIVNVVDIPANYQVYHNVGYDISDTPVDIIYKVQRNLVSVDVDPLRNTLTFNFAGNVSNDEFIVQLPGELIKDVQSVWIDDAEITEFKLTKSNDIATFSVMLTDTSEQLKLMGSEVIGKFVTKEFVLINQMLGITDREFYFVGDEIIVSGEVKNPAQLYKLSLDVISPSGKTVYHKDIHLVDSTKFSDTIHSIGNFREFGEYTIKITGPSAKNLFLPFEYAPEPKMSTSPMKQLDMGTKPSKVLCSEGLELLMKKSNGNAICLTESTAKILVERGWAVYF